VGAPTLKGANREPLVTARGILSSGISAGALLTKPESGYPELGGKGRRGGVKKKLKMT
jgi:hypothetical protein